MSWYHQTGLPDALAPKKGEVHSLLTLLNRLAGLVDA